MNFSATNPSVNFEAEPRTRKVLQVRPSSTSIVCMDPEPLRVHSVLAPGFLPEHDEHCRRHCSRQARWTHSTITVDRLLELRRYALGVVVVGAGVVAAGVVSDFAAGASVEAGVAAVELAVDVSRESVR